MADKNVSVLTSGSYTGSQTVREFEVTDLKVEDGKLNGTAVGSVEKEGTGIVDKVRLSFTDVPFEGVGGGSGGSNVEIVNLELGESEDPEDYSLPIPVTSCDKTFAELMAAANAGKVIIGRLLIDLTVHLFFINHEDDSDHTLTGNLYDFELGGESVILKYYDMYWSSYDDTPTFAYEPVQLQPYGGN